MTSFFRRGPAAVFLALFIGSVAASADDAWLPASPDKLPRWRGFNLQNMFTFGHEHPFAEADFQIIHDFGFNFVRIPMDYRIWIKNGDWTQIDEQKAFVDLDQALAWAAKYHVHVCLNFHRAPGYTVAKPSEARSLWTDPEAQRVCALHWAAFARHYKGVPNERLSFDLFNEPPKIDPQVYANVVGLVVKAIRQEDPDRLIMADGLRAGYDPCPLLVPLHIAQATRGYEPHSLTHYQASWMANSDKWPLPTWPGADGEDGAWLWQHDIVPWQNLEAQGVGVMVGEWGCFDKTPYDVTLRWMEDNLVNFQRAGWGWALWNLYGGFGIFDSYRPGAVYEDYRGHKLDRRMLTLLQRY